MSLVSKMGSVVQIVMQAVVCTLMIFLLHPASGMSLEAQLRDALQEAFPQERFSSANHIDDSKTVINGNQIPDEILQQIMQAVRQAQDSHDEVSDEKDDSELNQDALTELLNQITGNNLIHPSPTPSTPTAHTITRVKMSLNPNRNDENNNKDSNKSEEQMSLDDHLNNLWSSALPILMKNNNASTFSKPDLHDISTIFPDLPAFLGKLHDVHKPGHVTVMMINPKHTPVDRDVVKNTNVHGEIRHLLAHAKNHPLFEEDESEPAAHDDDDDDEVPAEIQSFIRSLLQHTSENELPSEDEHKFDDNPDSPWTDDEKNVVSHIIKHLHLFDKPGHLSAVSFNPKHIVHKKKPKFIHISLTIPLPTEDSSDDSETDNPLDDESTSIYPQDIFNTDDSIEPSLKKTHVIHYTHMRIKIHRPNKSTVHKYPLNNLLDDYPALPQHTLEAHKKKPTFFAFMIHNHHQAPQEPTTPSPDLQSLLNEIFDLPVHRDFPNEEFEQDPNEEEYSRIPHKQFFQQENPFKEFLSQLLSSENQVQDSSTHRTSNRLSSTPVEHDAIDQPQDGISREELFNLLNNMATSQSPDDVTPSDKEDEDVIPSEGIVPIHVFHGKIKLSPDTSSDEIANLIGKLFG